MADLPYFPFFVREVLGEVAALDAEERGVHLSLLLACWSEGGFLTADRKRLARLCGTDAARLEAIWPAISGHWQEVAGRISNPRVTGEMQRARDLQEARRKGAAATNAQRGAQRGAQRSSSDTPGERSAGRSDVGNSGSGSGSGSEAGPGTGAGGGGTGTPPPTTRECDDLRNTLETARSAKYGGKRFPKTDAAAFGRVIELLNEGVPAADIVATHAAFLEDSRHEYKRRRHTILQFLQDYEQHVVTFAEAEEANATGTDGRRNVRVGNVPAGRRRFNGGEVDLASPAAPRRQLAAVANRPAESLSAAQRLRLGALERSRFAPYHQSSIDLFDQDRDEWVKRAEALGCTPADPTNETHHQRVNAALLDERAAGAA